ncbi:TetR/AcrR family transcriptional regulator [Bacillus carboniphilus]|uniref:TetR/AcrR family transcriptional regulator n=1 Tax=Bacillus carboniphilus TaxID=86663 RepID=A0ABY9K099_9BACI|nr:TetR/AcrR family transcriptional regulator [Bacillus carboniphilus]WLR43280.1 TetR/AcrR family transcriptional regulator [Bacillus carboniphilus]
MSENNFKEWYNSSQTKPMSEKQQKIVDAAIEIFSEKGFSATSTSEIAKKAGVAEGTIFRHYSTKKNLLLSIVMPAMTNYIAPFLTKSFVAEVFQQEHSSYEGFIRTILQNRYDFVKEHLSVLKIFAQEVFYHDELQDQFKETFTEEVYPKFLDVIVHFQEKGDIIDVSPQIVLRMTMTTLIGFIISRFIVLPNNDWDDDLEMEKTIHILISGLKKR